MDAVVIERHKAVAVLRLNRPETMNALQADVKAVLEPTIPALVADDSVRAIVITGSGRAFSAGGDVRSMQDPEGRRGPVVRTRMQRNHSWSRLLLDCDKPVIAAVNGAAVGGGLALALLADLVVASSEAYFMSGFTRLGAAPDLGIALTLPHAIGMLRAKEMLLLNKRVAAEEAVAIGLANRVVAPERLMDEALSMAQELAAGPTPSISLTKMLMKRAYEDGVEQFFEREQMAQAVAFSSKEFAEGVEAFVAKRRARFHED